MLAAVTLVWSVSIVGARAGDVKAVESEFTGFKLMDVRTEQGERGFLILEATVKNMTKHPVENVLVFIVAKGIDGKEIRRVYTIVKPPLPLEPGAAGNVRISILTRRIPVSVIEYKVVGLL